MPTGKITARLVSAIANQAKIQDKALYLWDTELKGFGCHLFPSGKASWLHQHWEGGRGGRLRRIVFGSLPSMDVQSARTRAAKLKVQVDDGVDVLSLKAQRREAKRLALRAPTTGDLVSIYLKKSDGSGYWKSIETRLKHAVGSLPKKPRDIQKTDIRRLIASISDSGKLGAARALFTTLSAFFNFCVREEYLEHPPINGVSVSPRPARDRVLSDQEIAVLWSASSNMKMFGDIYRLCLLTAQRREEVSGMAWSELDLDNAVWTIPSERTKNGKPHIVHLSRQALSILSATDTQNGSDLVFSTTGTTPISGFSKAKLRVDSLMPGNTPRWRVHDLRRTAASGMARLGVLPAVIERVLNHVSGVNGGLVGIYQRYDYLPERKAALEAWGADVEQITSLSQPPHSVADSELSPLTGVFECTA
jgi:integrase